MTDAGLDAIIRKLAKQQHKTLTAAVKKQRDGYAALAAKAKDAETRLRYRQLAKDALGIGTATVKRLQTSADNAAYSYARSIKQAIADAQPKKDAAKPKRTSPKKAAPAKNATKKTKD